MRVTGTLYGFRGVEFYTFKYLSTYIWDIQLYAQTDFKLLGCSYVDHAVTVKCRAIMEALSLLVVSKCKVPQSLVFIYIHICSY